MNRFSQGCWATALAAVWAVSVFWGAAESSWAQLPGRPQRRGRLIGPRQEVPRAEPKGTVAAIGRGMILVVAPTGQRWQLQVMPKAKVRIKGTALPNVLAPGQFIAFTADVEKKQAAVQGKVDKLVIFTPSEERAVGVFPSQNVPGGPAAGEGPPAGIPQQQPAERADLGPPIERFDIGAQIRSINKGKLTLFAPNSYFRPLFEIELAEQPEITLDLIGLNYLALAKPGDKLEARGMLVGLNMAQVNEVTIELAQPLGQQTAIPAKRPPRRTRRPPRKLPAEQPSEEPQPGITEEPKL